MGSLVTINTPVKTFTWFSSSNSSSICCSSFSAFKFKNPGRFKKSSFIASSADRRRPDSLWGDYGSPFPPLILLFQKYASVFGDCCDQETKFLQSGALGTALVSVTAAAKVKIRPFVATLASNPTFVSGLCALAAAQSIKVFLNFWVERKWDFRIMFASGGMPSSHSALCTALTTCVAICHGAADSLFPVSLGFSLVVMYDAIGVKRHAGKQAEVLNLIVEDLFEAHPISQRKLKELIGHTPSQVFAGALLGIIVAWICCQACLNALL